MPSYRHDVSFALVHEFDRHAHAFAVETDVVVAHDDFKKERKEEREEVNCVPKRFPLLFFFPSSLLSVWFRVCVYRGFRV